MNVHTMKYYSEIETIAGIQKPWHIHTLICHSETKRNELSTHIGNVHTMKYYSETKTITRIQKLWHIHTMKCHSETKRNELSIHTGNELHG